MSEGDASTVQYAGAASTNRKPRAEWIAERPQNQPRLLKLFESPEHLQAACDRYFEEREANGNRPTWSGLALHLGYESRQSMWAHLTGERGEGVGEEWRLPLKRAASRIEARHEERLYDPACAGAIFALKQRGWTDVPTTAVQGNVSVGEGLRGLFGRLQEGEGASAVELVTPNPE